MPTAAFAHGQLTSAYALRGETERASAELAAARELARGDGYSRFTRLRAAAWPDWGTSKVRAMADATFFVGLHNAGMPEE